LEIVVGDTCHRKYNGLSDRRFAEAISTEDQKWTWLFRDLELDGVIEKRSKARQSNAANLGKDDRAHEKSVSSAVSLTYGRSLPKQRTRRQRRIRVLGKKRAARFWLTSMDILEG
jgi:hypothetical protein